MMFKYLISLSCLLLCTHVQAFPCFVTVMKDRCWDKYAVTVDVIDVINDNKKEIAIDIPVGKSWARDKFVCRERQELGLVAQFSPTIWKKDEGKKYPGKHNWFLPEKVAENTTAWNVTICYPKDFSDIPLPPGDVTNCGCDKTGIPDIPPQ